MDMHSLRAVSFSYMYVACDDRVRLLTICIFPLQILKILSYTSLETFDLCLSTAVVSLKNF